MINRLKVLARAGRKQQENQGGVLQVVKMVCGGRTRETRWSGKSSGVWRPRGLGNLSENSFCRTFRQQCTSVLAGCEGGQAGVPLWWGRAGQWLLGEEKGGIFQMKMTDGVSERPVLVTQGRGG